MTQNEEIHGLLGRYAAEVGKHLPRRSREDIEKELAAGLADRLDDRAASLGREATLEDALALLKETGNPGRTAASYRRHPHLVGPDLLPLFTMVSRIALPIVFAVTVGAQALALALGDVPAATIAEHVLRILGSALGGALQVFALAVIAFAVLERVLPEGKARTALDPGEPWDPRDLPKADDGAAIRAGDQVVTIVFGTLFLAFLAALPRIPWQLVRNAGGAVLDLRVGEGLLRLIPFFFVSAAADVLVAVFLLTRRTHSWATVGAKAVAKALSIVGAGLLLAAWPYLSLAAPSLPEAALGVRVANWGIRVAAVLGIVAGSFELARDVLRFTRARRAAA